MMENFANDLLEDGDYGVSNYFEKKKIMTRIQIERKFKMKVVFEKEVISPISTSKNTSSFVLSEIGDLKFNFSNMNSNSEQNISMNETNSNFTNDSILSLGTTSKRARSNPQKDNFSYAEKNSDSDNDSIFTLSENVQNLASHWISNLVTAIEFECENIIGVKSLVFIPKDTILGYISGKIINTKSQLKKVFKERKSLPHYVFELNPKLWIDGNPIYPESKILSFINHSCINQNCHLERLTKSKIYLRTIKDVYPNEFLNYNYALTFLYSKQLNVHYVKCVCHKDCKTLLS